MQREPYDSEGMLPAPDGDDGDVFDFGPDVGDPPPDGDFDATGLDFATDQVQERDEDELDGDVDVTPGDGAPPEQPLVAGTSGLDATVDAIVELVNARDLDGLADLLAPGVEARFLGEVSPAGVIEGMGDLLLRHPNLVLTRGDLGPQAIAAAWMFDRDQDGFKPVGYLMVEPADGEEDRIERLDYVEELVDAGHLVVEVPDRAELSEWDDWSEMDED